MLCTLVPESGMFLKCERQILMKRKLYLLKVYLRETCFKQLIFKDTLGGLLRVALQEIKVIICHN